MRKFIKAFIIVAFFVSAVTAGFLHIKYTNAINNISNNTYGNIMWIYPENKDLVSVSKQVHISGRVYQVLTNETDNSLILQLESIVNNSTANKFSVNLPKYIIPNSILEIKGEEANPKEINFEDFMKTISLGNSVVDIDIVTPILGNSFIKSIKIFK